ncbi:hypothetical protein JW935_26635 [candidate division KSB1 bacterium]|nr:hypothetical protein [candidate division KSB1 bacterium]
MNKKSGSVKLYVIFIVFLALVAVGYKIVSDYFKGASQARNLVQEAMIIEGRFKYIGPFMKLKAWIHSIDHLEGKYFEKYGTYTELENLKEMRIFPDVIARDIRQEFWDNKLLLDFFIPFEALRDTLKSDFGIAFENYLSGVDSSRWRITFNVKPSEWDLHIYENSDINMDGDRDDILVYGSSQKDKRVCFKDLATRRDYEAFLTDYSNLLGDRLPPLQDTVIPDR